MVNVTIGVPVYNGAKYLDEALSALCAQTYKDLEILISDNASTDATPQIIKKWAGIDPRINFLRQEETMPALPHFLWVISNAKSKWFCYAAHDDLWSPNYIEELIKPLEKSKTGVISVPHRVMIDVDGNHGNERVYRPYHGNGELISIVKHNFKIVYSGWYYALYDRQALMKFQKSLKYFDKLWGGDFATYLSLLFTDRIVGNDKAIFYQRDTGLSGQRYRPKTAKDKYIHYRDFWKEMLHHMNKSDLNTWQKITLLPALLRYANNVVKPRRIIKAWFKEMFGKNKKD